MKKPDVMIWVLVVMLLLPLMGCQLGPKPPTVPPGHFGPTLTLREVIERVNDNNRRIPTFWGRFSYEALIRDPESGRVTSAVELDNGTIQYRAPAEFRLRANKTAVGLVLDVGINRENFWLIAPEGPDAMWWGEVREGNLNMDATMPIQPQGMLEVLGITTQNINLLEQPAPILRFNHDARVYMLTWVHEDADRFLASREVWYDMNDFLPRKVLLFDRDGRVLIRADLSDHRPVDERDDQSPMMARVFDLFFPETGSWMNLKVTSAGFTRGNAPNDNSFRFIRDVPVSREIKIEN